MRRSAFSLILFFISLLIVSRILWHYSQDDLFDQIRIEYLENDIDISVTADLPLNIIPEDLKSNNYNAFVIGYKKQYGRNPPGRMKAWHEFAMEHNCSLDHERYKRIYKDLSVFRKRHEDCVKAGKCKKSDPIIPAELITRAGFVPHVSQITITKDSRIEVSDNDVTRVVVHAIQSFREHLPPMQFILNRLDEPRVLKQEPTKKDFEYVKYDSTTAIWTNRENKEVVDLMMEVCDNPDRKRLESHGFFLGPCSFIVTDKLVPIFSSSSVGSCFADIIFPSHYYLNAIRSAPWNVPLPPADTDEPVNDVWKFKIPWFHWRGSTTSGGAHPGNRYREFHRQRFVNKTHHMGMKGVIPDAAFTNVLQCQGSACDDQRDIFGPIVSGEKMKDSRDYKYLPDVDGNTFSQRFLPFLRFTQSLIFKIFMFEDWLTEQTVPYKHYVPVKMDLSDLEEKIQWARDHDKEAQKIALEAQRFAQDNLRYEDMQCYLFRLLLEYHALTVPQIE